MEELTLAEIAAGVLAVASAVVLLANAAEKIASAVRHAKAPNVRQDDRIKKLEDDVEEIKEKLTADHDRFEAVDKGNRVTQRALLALLDHGIDGNNIEQMQHAKEELQNHLINR